MSVHQTVQWLFGQNVLYLWTLPDLKLRGLPTHKASSGNPFGPVAPLGSITHSSYLSLGKTPTFLLSPHLTHRHGWGEDIILYSLTRVKGL